MGEFDLAVVAIVACFWIAGELRVNFNGLAPIGILTVRVEPLKLVDDEFDTKLGWLEIPPCGDFR